ncbi:MAG: response regulator transcription factor [Culicoidibacterales bacterium]
MRRFTIAIVEDEPNLQQLLKVYFQQAGLAVQCFHDYPQAREACEDEKIDAWILDIMLPNGDGRELLSIIRQKNPIIPIMCLSARDSEYDRIQGLELGSDDYITKPFSPKEVLLRMQRLLTRVYGESEPTKKMLNGYEIDFKTETVSDQFGNKLELTFREFQLLAYLIKYYKQPVTREQLLQALWGNDYFGSDRVVDDLVRRLRKKMPELTLETIYGQGYRLL